MSMRVSILGGSGYIGGELLRLLIGHPEVEVAQVTSRSQNGRYVHAVHPNLRSFTDLRFSSAESLEACDVLILALPHGQTAGNIEQYAGLAGHIIDTSADFRLRDINLYESTYGSPHPSPAWNDRFVYGLPERHREEISHTQYASGVGCNATVMNLALGPLADAGWLADVSAEIKVGSSEAGMVSSSASHHPERSGAVRVYSPFRHRHLSEVEQELQIPVRLAVTAIEMVRGAHLTAHCTLREDAPVENERDLWALYRQAYGSEPFVRLVSGRRGLYRYPEPKILAGTNFCDIGFAFDPASRDLVMIAALDNLVKGGAGTAVQVMNIMLGMDERSGLGFPGLHPI
jgi:LysW-gamma-L-alpha-aminoadipyl-6-phosphate/LysW-L-glutamyl-5-phosphate reductase